MLRQESGFQRDAPDAYGGCMAGMSFLGRA